MATNTLPPIHPGEILREEFMVPLALSANEIARSIGVTPARVAEIAGERRGITADTALRFSRYFSTTPDVWLNLQARYELEIAKRALGKTLDRIRPRAA